ncbi:MAG: Holliday junction resolvase Hjc [Candidatus ainarchaeum sp.]|nr:Holliday junction resolvase Hjc [Candidatus ainarchaeum sp.]
MTRYDKGANAERELIKMLDSRGFAVLRVAGSGVNPLPCPDVVALLNGKIIAFECKARKGAYLPIQKEQMDEEVSWAKKAGAIFVVAWKIPNKGWLFISPEIFHLAGKNYMLSLDNAKKHAIDLNVIIGQQSML